MKKLFTLSLLLLSISATAQNAVSETMQRFDDPKKGHTVFIPKGSRNFGIRGSFQSFNAGGDAAGSGYSVLSLLNIGDGHARIYNVSPSFNYFIKDDLSLGVSLDYSGFNIQTDLRADLRTLIPGYDALVADFDQEQKDDLSSLLNWQLSARHWVQNAGGLSANCRKYFSFFGSQTFGVYGDARLYARYSNTFSYPINRDQVHLTEKARRSQGIHTGLFLNVGVAVRLRDASTICLTIPIVDACFNYTWQRKEDTGNIAHMSSFDLTRRLNLLGLQFSYSRPIVPKKKNK